MSQPWILLLLAISAEVIGTSFLRLSEGMTRPLPTLLVFGAYAIAMALLSRVVLSIPLGPVSYTHLTLPTTEAV